MPLPNILPADLPANWTDGQIVSPDGVSVGLTPQHGYNTLNQYINNAQKAINQLREYLATAGFATDDGVAGQLASYLPLAGGTLSGILDHGGKRDINLGAPTVATDGATKGYVDTQAGLKLPLAGGTMTGNINFNSHKGTNLATPTATGDAATKGYVDTRDGLLLPKSGGTMTGILNHGGYRATNLGPPSATTDAATKAYVDTQVSGVKDIIGTGPLHTGRCRVNLISISSGQTRHYFEVLDDIVLVDAYEPNSYPTFSINFNRSGILFLQENSNMRLSISNTFSNYNPAGWSDTFMFMLGVGWRDLIAVNVNYPDSYRYTITSL